jgi:FkbM family methyltransferase
MKQLIRNILQRFGYDIVKTGVPYIPMRKKPGTINVGKYPIQMPGNSMQLMNYQLYPHLNSQFGRLALAIDKKYEGLTVIDVGANVGDTIAVLKSALDVPVIAVEGDDLCYEYLERNTRQFQNVYLIKSYLGEKAQSVNVNLEHEGWNTTIIPGEQGTKQIKFSTLDEVIKSGGFADSMLKLLKVDVEGFDTIVLRGAYEIIRTHQPVLFFEYNMKNMKAIQEDGLSTLLSFEKFGYERIVFFDHKGNLVLAADLQNSETVTYMHNYISSEKNLLAYFDICIFHRNDRAIADEFLAVEKNYL